MILEVLAWLSLAAIGIRLSVIDVTEHRLPNRLVVVLACIAGSLLAASAISSGDPGRLVRALACGAIVFAALLTLAIVVPSGLGMGDAKLGLVTGMFLGWLGWEWAYWGTFLAFSFGAAWALVLLARRRGTLSTCIAFGPCMLISVLVCAAAAAV